MKFRIRVGLLVCLMMSSGYLATRALGTITPAAAAQPPAGIYESYTAYAENAQYYLRDSGGYVGIFSADRSSEPIEVTGIELSCLREGDRAMILSGLPVSDRAQLLSLLEDLGS